ncbi:hypothetical protein GCM10011452_34370 [Gemmobacter lanyuensis]|uniref:siroheme decarboxylase n=1 Tax=Gemmobacter lanyuensis TaxID=1054497 RepID=A0A918MNB5_9RHOB|nr:AsnC family transcriptional regulator [Gemmobacter lanyuensis]GGW43137.1 hypothetical protein GCM10011452_34370 [Gemmobacter lanyuensis]
MDALDLRLLDEFQRDFPLTGRPFARVATALSLSEPKVLARLQHLTETGALARVGATVRPHTAGASTLAALAVPEAQLEEVATLVGAERGVNHSYQREDLWNLWFVATAPDAPALAASLSRIGQATGLKVLNLPLVRAFNIDLGFRLTGARAAMPADRGAATTHLQGADRAILQALSDGLPLLPRPYAALAARLGLTEGHLHQRIAALIAGGVITRLGLIVRHRALGYAANAMVAWALPEGQIPDAGRALATLPGVTLCYERRPVPGLWEHPLFCMIHARTRPEALAVLDRAARLPELAGAAPRILFSTRCFKQRGALIAEAA